MAASPVCEECQEFQRQLKDALSSPALANEVVGALACGALSITVCVPGKELGLPDDGTSVACLVKGRTKSELLVLTPSSTKLVLVKYQKLLAFCELEALLVVASKVQSHMLMRTPSMCKLCDASNTEPLVPPALAPLRKAALAAARHVALASNQAVPPTPAQLPDVGCTTGAD